jgi:predicted HTH transcriptional regulator
LKILKDSGVIVRQGPDHGGIWRISHIVAKTKRHDTIRPDSKSDRKSGSKPDRKAGQEVLERIIELIKASPYITQQEIAYMLGMARSTLNLKLSALKAVGRLRRVGPDKGGHWEILE